MKLKIIKILEYFFQNIKIFKKYVNENYDD